MTPNTVVHIPDLIRNGRNPYTQTVREALRWVSPNTLYDVLGTERADRYHETGQLDTLTLEEFRHLVDDPNVTVVE